MTSAAFNDDYQWSRFEQHRGYSKAFLDHVREKRRQQARVERRRAMEPVMVSDIPEPQNAPAATPEPENRVVAFSPLVRAIIIRIAAQHGLTYRDIIGRSMLKHIVAARMDAIMAVHLAKPGLPLSYLGRHFHRNRTTILHVLRKRGVR